MDEQTAVTASIVSYNDEKLLADTCDSVLKSTVGCTLELTVIDNASTDGTAKSVAGIPGVRVIRLEKNLGFGAAHNIMLNEKLGRYHCVINPDIRLSDDAVTRLVEIMDSNPDIAMACPAVYNADLSEQKLPKRTPRFSYMFLGRLARLGGVFAKARREYTMADYSFTDITDIEFCSGCFFIIRSDVFRKLGGFDERFFLYLEDADITRRARQYGRTVFCPQVSVTHLWQRDSAKRLKPLLIHLSSYLKYSKKWRHTER